MASENVYKTIGQRWDNALAQKPSDRIRWWQSPKIISHINKIVCGKAIGGLNAGAIRLLQAETKRLKIRRALSIGCGNAHKELILVKNGIVDHFYLFDISEESCKWALKRFKDAGLESKVTVFNEDFFIKKRLVKYDFIYWDNALHHMFNCHHAISRSYDCLHPEGIFFMNDFVGKSRFQWSDEELKYINFFRKSLPDSVFMCSNGVRLSREVCRPNLQEMIRADPSEAADSDAIIPSLKKVFKDPVIIPTGGTIYHSGLNDILANIDEDSPLLSHALKIDSKLTGQGIYQYAVCLAKK